MSTFKMSKGYIVQLLNSLKFYCLFRLVIFSDIKTIRNFIILDFFYIYYVLSSWHFGSVDIFFKTFGNRHLVPDSIDRKNWNEGFKQKTKNLNYNSKLL